MALSIFQQLIKPYFIKEDKIIEYPISLLALPNWPRFKNGSRQDVEIWKIISLSPSFIKLYCHAERLQKPYIILICLDGSGRLIVKKSYVTDKDYQFISNKEILDKFESKQINEIKISDLHINSKVLLQGDKDVWTVSYIFGLNNTVRVEKETESNDLPQYIRTTKSIDMIQKILPESNSKKLIESLLFEVGEGSTQPYKFQLETSGIDKYIGKFKTESGLNYIVNATFVGDTKIMIQFLTQEHGEKETNRGEFFRVMSTIVSILKEIYKKEPQLNEIEFYGKEKIAGEQFSQRTNIYIKYAQKNLGSDWIVKQKGNQINLIKKKKK